MLVYTCLFVAEGIGLCRRRSGPSRSCGPVAESTPSPPRSHRRGATLDRLIVYLALDEVDDEHVGLWGDHVSDDEYSSPTRGSAPFA